MYDDGVAGLRAKWKKDDAEMKSEFSNNFPLNGENQLPSVGGEILALEKPQLR